tara:strand:+ start:8880 stop:9443 length:564 start_codon:yes stop_codon:yes gene_type:complete
MSNNKKVPQERIDELFTILKTRFEKQMHHHNGMEWSEVQAALETHPDRVWSLNEMEETGGEPNVVGFDSKTKEYIFYDCAPESPKGRRSVCYDSEALESRKQHKPRHSELGMAEEMGVSLLTEAQYRELQTLDEFDTKTSSWVLTPQDIRERGGALFCDRRFGHVFIYHNAAESYYGARGFRAALRV